MNELNRNRILLFLLGITLGALVGGGIVFVNLKDLKTSNEVTESKFEQITNRLLNILSKEKDKEADKPKPSRPSSSNTRESVAKKDTLLDPAKPVTIVMDTAKSFTDTLSGVTNHAEEEIIVKKDELVASSTIEIIYLTEVKRSSADSLMEIVSSVKDDKKLPRSILVEYWKSPLNYRGYKLGKTKLVLFGITANEPLKLYQFDNSLFLKTPLAVYKLDFYNDYRVFDKVNNPVLTSLMNK